MAFPPRNTAKNTTRRIAMLSQKRPPKAVFFETNNAGCTRGIRNPLALPFNGALERSDLDRTRRKINHLRLFLKTLLKNAKKGLDNLSHFCYNNTVDYGALAQLGAHNTGSVGVRGSNPLCSTKEKRPPCAVFFLWWSWGEPPLRRDGAKWGSHFASKPMGACSHEARAKNFAHCANTPMLHQK